MTVHFAQNVQKRRKKGGGTGLVKEEERLKNKFITLKKGIMLTMNFGPIHRNVSRPYQHAQKHFNSLEQLMESLFPVEKQPVGKSPESPVYTMRPPANVAEFDDYFLVQLAVPGFGKEDIKIDLDDNFLIVEGKRDAVENKETPHKFIQREFNNLHFKRTFRLSKLIDQGQIEAKYEAGILHLHLAKVPAAVKKPARQIEIG